MAEIEVQSTGARTRERRQQELHDLTVRCRACVSVQLTADLHDLARSARSACSGTQHASGVAKTRDAGFIEEVRIDARDLRRGVCAYAKHPAGQRVDHLERLQFEVASGTGQQRIEVFDERRRHEAIAARPKMAK